MDQMLTGTNVSIFLAKNILDLRKKRNWSQKDLAEYAKVPRSTITYLESGEGNPSLQNLTRVAEALHVGVDELLSRPRNSTQLYGPRDFLIHKRGGGRASLTKLLPDRIQGIEMDRMDLAKGGTVFGGQPHLRGTKEYLYVLAGEITVSVAGESHVVGAGHLVAFEGDQPHSYRSTGAKDAEAISVVIPVSKFA
jgi:transcriptional regulator with XRE-family HTH domain